MPDISACTNLHCDKMDECYRFRCIWSERQCVAYFKPDYDGTCAYFWGIEPQQRILSPSDAASRASKKEAL